LVVWPLLFAMDFQDSASKEVAALQSRQQYLATLAEQRCAPAAPAQPAPVRKREAASNSSRTGPARKSRVAHAHKTLA
jgi:hypothetical protein